jgi:ADP-ribose pyrophosphatase YjhB (NUDIX family)
MKLIKLMNPENASEEEVKNFIVRAAVRAVIMNEEGKIALINVVNEGYYKLPGGGIEEGEDKSMALQRECREETGSEVEVVGEIGIIIEYRKISNLKHTSYCYLTKTKGDKSQLNLTDEEKERGSELEWMSPSESLKAMRESNPAAFVCSAYIAPRDLAFLEEAEIYFDSVK